MSTGQSDRCADSRHATCSACSCSCHVEAALFSDLEGLAATLNVRPHVARDLAAQLRSGLTLVEAVRVARYVIDLGWRPVLRDQLDGINS